ncbi:MAG TPA: nitrous oxide reductase family maturation protein NosD [Chitinophagaceae bacterium]|nr:nitrous oxide reductase family maturation protein NosD [Chitinophagaceae bacterium]
MDGVNAASRYPLKTLLSILLLNASIQAFSKTIEVGVGQPAQTLKQAITIAVDGDTIHLQPGTYKEGRIILTKSLTLLGDHAILDGEKKYEILVISGKNIRVKGITFLNAGYSAMNDYAAIKLIDATNILLENNSIINAYFAIHVSNTTLAIIRNNKIRGTPSSEQLTGNGIHIWKSRLALIEYNQVEGHRDGIYFEFVTGSLIQGNLSEKNIRYGLHFMFSNDDTYKENIFRNNGAGVAVMYSKKVWMERNHFEMNWGGSSYGILLKDIADSHIIYNTFLRNTTGIHMEGTSRIMVENNIFKENGYAIKVQASCNDNNFKYNNFSGNSFDVATNGSLVLNTFDKNHWDKYEGYDINKDGIGDIPYHPVSLFAMIVEDNPTAMILYRSFTVTLLDKAEKAIPGLTPENLVDHQPLMKTAKW